MGLYVTQFEQSMKETFYFFFIFNFKLALRQGKMSTLTRS